MIEILEATQEADIAGVRELLGEYFEWTFALIGGAEGAPTFLGHEDELRNLPGPYARPAGRLLLARVDSRAAGCVAYRAHGDGAVELKRLYVRPEVRGKKIGRRLVTTLLDQARRSGIRSVVLDSHRSMTSAHAIYRGAGFQDVPAPMDFPPALKPVIVFMELRLAATPVSRQAPD